MLKKCAQCPLQWEEPIPQGTATVQCPKCGATVPRAVVLKAVEAQKARQAAQVAAPTAPPPPEPTRTTPLATRPTLPNRTTPSPPAGGPVTRPAPLATRPAHLRQAAAESPPEAEQEPLSRTRALPGRPPAAGAPMPPTPPPRRVAAEATPASGFSFDDDSRAPFAPRSVSPTVPQPASKTREGEHSMPSAAGAPTGSAAEGMQQLVGRTIGGYKFLKILGAGGMGAVFLAHQISLDREVAVKVLPARFAANPDLLARFTREALAAAQLNHHNIVQVHDVGSEEDVHFISMELVRGESLADAVRKSGRLSIDDAAAFVLQAARGLKYAHDRGIIHRDIKPGNLMISELGVVKIADMGLAKMSGQTERSRAGGESSEALKRAGGQLTMNDVAMGTPAYMSPEQARDAASVDARADQYSLGCTLYYLTAGMAPYSGTTAFELISKHMKEPLTPIDVHVRNVPEAFRRIIERTLEKDPAKRYPDLGGMVKDLEAYLGVGEEAGPFRPREQHLATLEEEQKAFYAAPALKIARAARLAFAVLIPLAFLAALFTKHFSLAGGILGLGVLTAFGHFIIDGIATKEHFFRRTRSLFFGMPWRSWLKTIGAAVLVIAVLMVMGWLVYWLVFAVLAAVLAAAYQYALAKRLREQRRPALESTQALLKELRLRGLSEEALHDFVCRFGGAQWEEFFERLFGYDAMVLARGKWARTEGAAPRKRHAVWRDPLARWLDGIEQGRKTARETRQLARVEAKRLKAEGVGDKEAERQAAEAATKILDNGFLKAPPKEDAQLAEKIKQARKQPLVATGWFIAARALAGLAVIFGVLVNYADAYGLNLPDFVVNLIQKTYHAWGYGGSPYALVAGIALIVMAFSRRLVPSFIVIIGALLMVGCNLAATLSGGLAGGGLLFWAGAALLVAGAGWAAVGKLTGKGF